MIALLLAGLALGSPALEALDRGDLAWFTGDRRLGARAWREAVDLADPDDTQDQAIAAMARVRLMTRAGSNLAPLAHARRLGRSLHACGEEPWCLLAWTDLYLLAAPPLGNRKQAEDLVQYLGNQEILPERTAARAALLAGTPLPSQAIPEAQRGGLGEAVARGLVADQGPWLLGLGLIGGGALGIGVGVHVTHPDLWRREWLLSLDGWAATGGVGGEVHLRGPGTVSPVLSARGSHGRWYDGEDWVIVSTARVAPGVAVQGHGLRGELGPVARWDLDLDSGDIHAGHGVWASGTWDGRSGSLAQPKGAWLGLRGEQTVQPLAVYGATSLSGDLRGYLPVARGVLAARIRGATLLGEAPEIREPWSELRGPLPGEWRAPWLVEGDLEFRHPVWGPLWLAGFGGAAWLDNSLHPAGGGGIRWSLTGDGSGAVRLDAGFTPDGWELDVGWGEAF